MSRRQSLSKLAVRSNFTPRRLRGAPASAAPAHPGALRDAAERSSREIVRELLAGGQDVTAERVREATGVGRRRAYELLARVRAEGNGQGTT